MATTNSIAVTVYKRVGTSVSQLAKPVKMGFSAHSHYENLPTAETVYDAYSGVQGTALNAFIEYGGGKFYVAETAAQLAALANA